MADFSKTVTNSIQCFGPAPSTQWNAFSWGVGTWGEKGSALTLSVGKLLTFTQFTDSSVSKAFSKDPIQNTMGLTFETNFETLSQGNYFYVFPKPSTNAEDRALTTYTSQSDAATTYTSMSVAVTVWS